MIQQFLQLPLGLVTFAERGNGFHRENGHLLLNQQELRDRYFVVRPLHRHSGRHEIGASAGRVSLQSSLQMEFRRFRLTFHARFRGELAVELTDLGSL